MRCPKASDLARKPAIDRNPPKGKKRSRGEGASNPKSVDPRKRVSEFPSESLSVKRYALLPGVSGGALVEKVRCECPHPVSQAQIGKKRLSYYAQHLAAEAMSRPLSAFKAARLFSPAQAARD